MTEETKVSSFFLEILPGRSIRSRPGRSIRSLPGLFQFFPIFTFKVSLPGFSKFYRSWKLRFRFPVISCALPGISKFSSSWKECRFLPFTANFSQRKNFPKIYKNVSSWKTHFFPNFTEAGKPIYWKAIQEKENVFLWKYLTFCLKNDIIKLERMRKGKCGNGKI